MSCFVVEDTTINRIATKVEAILLGTDRLRHDIKDEAQSLAGVPYTDDKFAAKLGLVLHKMNVCAFESRYPTRVQRGDYTYRHRAVPADPLASASDAAVLKSLQVLIYQASEGTISTGADYKFCVKLSNLLAMRIASEHPDFKSTAWE